MWRMWLACDFDSDCNRMRAACAATDGPRSKSSRKCCSTRSPPPSWKTHTECLTPQIQQAISDLAGTLVAQVLGKVLTKAAEGGANALLIYRLGHLTLREIRPIKP